MKYQRTLGFVVGMLSASVADAQISRVFVSVNGNDSNACSSITTPCRTIDGGVTQVEAHGEVIIIDSGSFASPALGVTKSVKIDAPPGVVAFSATSLVINPGAGGTVVVRGLTLKALTPGSGIGLRALSGTVFVENSVLDGWATGVSLESASSKAFIKNSVVRNNTTGLASTTSAISVGVEGSFFENNGTGVSVSGGGHVALTRTVISGNTTGLLTSGASSQVSVQFCQVSHNVTGVRAASSGTARVSDSSVAGNGTGFENSSANFHTFSTNQMSGNTANTAGTITPVALQ